MRLCASSFFVTLSADFVGRSTSKLSDSCQCLPSQNQRRDWLTCIVFSKRIVTQTGSLFSKCHCHHLGCTLAVNNDARIEARRRLLKWSETDRHSELVSLASQTCDAILSLFQLGFLLLKVVVFMMITGKLTMCTTTPKKLQLCTQQLFFWHRSHPFSPSDQETRIHSKQLLTNWAESLVLSAPYLIL